MCVLPCVIAAPDLLDRRRRPLTDLAILCGLDELVGSSSLIITLTQFSLRRHSWARLIGHSDFGPFPVPGHMTDRAPLASSVPALVKVPLDSGGMHPERL